MDEVLLGRRRRGLLDGSGLSLNALPTLSLRAGSPVGAGADPFATVRADSSDSALLAGFDDVVAVEDGASTIYFGRDGSDPFRLLWVDRDGGLLRGDASGATPVKVGADGPPPFDAPYAMADDRLPGTRSPGDAFAHSPDALVEWVATIPSSGSQEVFVRRASSADYWRVYLHPAFTRLYEVSPAVGGAVLRAAGGGSANGRAVVTLDGPEITVRSGAVTVPHSSSRFVTETAGRVHGLGTGGAVADLVTWPLDPGGEGGLALAALAASAAASPPSGLLGEGGDELTTEEGAPLAID